MSRAVVCTQDPSLLVRLEEALAQEQELTGAPSPVLLLSVEAEAPPAEDPAALWRDDPAGPPQVVEQARSFWAGFPNVSASKAGRAYYLTDDDLLLPGLNVGKTAARLAEALHPTATTSPAKSSGPRACRRRERGSSTSTEVMVRPRTQLTSPRRTTSTSGSSGNAAA